MAFLLVVDFLIEQTPVCRSCLLQRYLRFRELGLQFGQPLLLSPL